MLHSRLQTGVGVALAVLLALPAFAVRRPDGPVNLGARATIRASQQHSEAYAPGYLADRLIPATGSRDDAGKAWCLPKSEAKDAWLTLQWDEPVSIACVVYWGRTAWLDNENFRSCEVYLNGAREASVRAKLDKGPQAQCIALPNPTKVRSLTLRFPTNDGGPNPGASEIGVFARVPSAADLDLYQHGVPAIDPALSKEVASGTFGFTKLLVTQRYPIDSSHVYTYHQEGLRMGGGLWVVDYSSNELDMRRIVDSSEGEILDACLHYDGHTILFSWKRTASEPFQLYTTDIDGGEVAQLTDHPSNNFNACWLPDGGIAFLSDRKPAFAYCWRTTTPILWRCDADGTNVIRISANYLNDFTPSVLANGRIVYSRWEYVDRPAIPIQSLWSMNPDGTRLEGLFGNRTLSPATFMDAREIPGANGRILCVLTAHNGPCQGAIGLINASLGANAQDAIHNLTPEVDIGRVGTGNGNHIRGPYLNPYPLDDQYYVVSREGTIQLRDYAGQLTHS